MAGLVALGAIGATIPAAAAAGSLVIDPAGLQGFHAERVPLQDVAGKIPMGRAASSLQASGARRGQLRLRSGAFVFRDARTAAAALGRWVRQGPVSRVVIGAGGAARTTGHRQLDSVVVWRDGARLGLVELRGPRAVAGTADAEAFARLAEVALRSALPRTAWAQLLSSVGSQGQVTRRMALRALELSFGGVPGAQPVRGPRGIMHDSGLTIAWALRFLPQMSVAQRRFVLSRLGLTANPVRARSTSGAGFGDDPSFVRSLVLEEMAAHWVAVDENYIGLTFPFKVLAGTTTKLPSSWDAGTTPATETGGTWNGGGGVCWIRMLPATFRADDSLRNFVVAHELWHCWEAAIIGNASWASLTPWVMEGLPEWAAVEAVSHDPSVRRTAAAELRMTDWLRGYVLDPHTSLFARTYDGDGFFGHVQDVSGRMWSRVIPTIKKGLDDGLAYDAAGGNDDMLLSTWGSSVFRAYPDLAWRMDSPIKLHGTFPGAPPGGLGTINGRDTEIDTVPVATSQWVINANPDKPLIRVQLTGHNRLRSGSFEYPDFHDGWYCTASATECECPANTYGTVPPHDPLGAQSLLGVTGDPDRGNSGEVSFHSLDEFCHPKPQPPAGTGESGGAGSGGTNGGGPLGCATGCGGSTGDPHIDTLGGYFYLFGAVGEFTALRSTGGDLEIQARQQLADRSLPFMSINTSVAVRVGRSTVEADRAGDSLRLLLNHHRASLRAGRVEALPGGGSLYAVSPSEITLTWPDHTVVEITDDDGIVSYLVFPSAGRAGKLAGLLGNLGVPPADSLVGRDGRHYDPAVILQQNRLGLGELYHGFGESWRVQQSHSLFTYARGQSTRTFTDRRFPKPLLFTTPAARGPVAVRVCRGLGITNPRLYADCLYDVKVSGQRRWGKSDAHAGRIVRAQRPPANGGGSGGGAGGGGGGSGTGGPRHFTTTCYVGDVPVPPGTDQTIAPGTGVGISVGLEPLPNDAQYTFHWTVPPGQDFPSDSTGSGSSSVLPDLEAPGHYTVQAMYAGDATHPPAQSAICSWTVTG